MEADKKPADMDVCSRSDFSITLMAYSHLNVGK